MGGGEARSPKARSGIILCIIPTPVCFPVTNRTILMSWTDIYPVLTDEQLAEYQSSVSADEAEKLAELLDVARTVNGRDGKHLVVTSLFWKKAQNAEGELPPITRELMMNAAKEGLISRYPPWDHYVQPLLDGAAYLHEVRPDVVFRVYLAADLEFLVEDLVAAGCEVKLMRSSSIRHNPGALWRFLALEEKGKWVTVTDADRGRDVLVNVERTEMIMQSGLGMWRVPYIYDSFLYNGNDPGFYRPIIACQFGAVGGQPIELLMKAFLWHTLRGTMTDRCTIGAGKKGKRTLPIMGTDWPTYGFDEWFLLAAVYPRLAFGGVLTFYPLNESGLNHWFPLDVEYVTWANPKSEVLYFGNPDLLVRKKRKGPSWAARTPEKVRPALVVADEALFERSPDAEAGGLTLVVARYDEDLRWIFSLPADVKVAVYNKGKRIRDKQVLERIDHLVALSNRGRAADSYLCHLEKFAHDPEDGWTAFSGGDPLSRDRQFIHTLQHRDGWEDVQVLAGESGEPELCSAATLSLIGRADESGVSFLRDYRSYHGLPEGCHVSSHFLDGCGLTALADEAWRAVLALRAPAAMFAVRNDRLARLPEDRIPAMRKLAREHHSHAHALDRLWLHLFGLPFIAIDAKSGKGMETGGAERERSPVPSV
jgi:hypothetical protein